MKAKPIRLALNHSILGPTCRMSSGLLTSLWKRWLHDHWDLAERHWKGLQLCTCQKVGTKCNVSEEVSVVDSKAILLRQKRPQQDKAHLRQLWSWRRLRNAVAHASKRTHWRWQKRQLQAFFDKGMTQSVQLAARSESRLIDNSKGKTAHFMTRNSAAYGIHVFQGSASFWTIEVWTSSLEQWNSEKRRKAKTYHFQRPK